MNSNPNSMEEGDSGNRSPEVGHSLSNMTATQNVQNVAQTSAQTVQSQQLTINTTASLIGKSVSLDLNPKLSLMKPLSQTATMSTEANKITTTVRLK